MTEQAQANSRERLNSLRGAFRKDSAGQQSTAWRDGGGKKRSKFNLQRRHKVCKDERRRCTKGKSAESNLTSRGESVLRKVPLRRFNREWIRVHAAAVRRAKLQRRGEQDAAPCSNIKDPYTVRWECVKEACVRPALNPRECEARGWMQSGAERLARINRHHRIARGTRLLAPRWSNHDASNRCHGELGPPGRLPRLCGDRTNIEVANPTKSKTADGDRGEARKLFTQLPRCRSTLGGVSDPRADAHRCGRVVWEWSGITTTRSGSGWFRTCAGWSESREPFADRLSRLWIAGDGEFEPAAVAQL